MKKILTYISIILFAFIAIFTFIIKEQSFETIDDKAKSIHNDIIVLDTHIDIEVKNFSKKNNYSQKLDTQVNLPAIHEGGLDVPWLIVYTKQGNLNKKGYKKAALNAMAKFKAIHYLCDSIAPKQIELALSSSDVERIYKSGKKAIMIGVENAYPLGEDITNFKKYYELGARYISLSHNGHSQYCDSSTGENDNRWLHNGLSKLGEKAVIEMNRLGIMIDVSHVSKESMKQIVALSKAPIIASHSSARALCNHNRNLDDEQLELIKNNGGVVQVVAFASYLNAKKYNAFIGKVIDEMYEIAISKNIKWIRKKEELKNFTEQELDTFYYHLPNFRKVAMDKVRKNPNSPPEVDVSDFVDHIDYIIKKIGINHVGISSDFDGGGGVKGWNNASETLNVTKELVRRGYTKKEIAKLWGENLLRVLNEVQQIAKN